jgi:hypothetical protein
VKQIQNNNPFRETSKKTKNTPNFLRTHEPIIQTSSFTTMKILGLTIALMPTILALSETATTTTDSILTNIDSRHFVLGQSSHDRDHHRKVKVTVEKNVDDDSTDGYNTKTVTSVRTVDDDNTNGSAKSSSHSKTKVSASSPYEIPNDISLKASSTGTTASSVSNSKHHKNSTVTDDAVSSSDDDEYPSNKTTPTSDMMDVLNGNMDHDTASNTSTFGKSGKIVLPPEHEPSETWTVAIVTLFSSMAISLCLTTAIRRCRKNNRRTGYQEVNNIVV